MTRTGTAVVGRKGKQRSGDLAVPVRQRVRSSMIRTRLALWCRDQAGVSAVEFALFAPILFFGLVATVDIGLALYQRMTVDHVLRAGAQSAMADQGKDAVLKVLQTTAAKNFTVATQTADPEALSLSVDRYCACPENTGLAIACSTTCSGSAPTNIYYRLSATKTYSGIILPQMNFGPSLQVQVR
jgi:Flp pilus assembly protein TadG